MKSSPYSLPWDKTATGVIRPPPVGMLKPPSAYKPHVDPSVVLFIYIILVTNAERLETDGS